MIERLMAWSLRNRAAVLFLVAVTVAAGVWAVRTIPIDAFPDVTNIQVEVVSAAPGLSPLEIEQFVTYPIESSMRGLPGLALMRSVTKYGISVVTLVFEDDVDIYFARQLVFERLAEAARKVPEGVETTMGPVATAMGEIYQYTLEPRAGLPRRDAVDDLARLRTLQDWVVTPLLKSVPGVTEVNSFGGYLQEYQVVVDPDRLLKYDLPLEAVHERIRDNNSNVGGSIVSQQSEQYIIRGVGLIRSEDDIRKIVLQVRGRHAGVRRGPRRGAHGPRRPPGRRREGRHPRGGRRHRHDAARREQPRGRPPGRREGARDQREQRPAGRPGAASRSTSGRRWSRPARGR